MAIDVIVFVVFDLRHAVELGSRAYDFISRIREKVEELGVRHIAERVPHDNALHVAASCTLTPSRNGIISTGQGIDGEGPGLTDQFSKLVIDDVDTCHVGPESEQGSFEMRVTAGIDTRACPKQPLEHTFCQPDQVSDFVGWTALNLLEDECCCKQPDDCDVVKCRDDTNSLVRECHLAIARNIEGRSRIEIHIFILALRCVAVSFRRLSLSEWYDAVMTLLLDDAMCANIPNLGLEDGQDLMRLCANVLIVRSDGNVDFGGPPMKELILNAEPLGESVGHETMAQACLRQVKHVLRPWQGILDTIAEYTTHPFLKYARRYWKKHYGLVESSQNDLPSRLLRKVEIELFEILDDGFLRIEIRRRAFDVGYDLAMENGWTGLRQLCEQLGGSPGRTAFPGPRQQDLTTLCRELDQSGDWQQYCISLGDGTEPDAALGKVYWLSHAPGPIAADNSGSPYPASSLDDPWVAVDSGPGSPDSDGGHYSIIAYTNDRLEPSGRESELLLRYDGFEEHVQHSDVSSYELNDWDLISRNESEVSWCQTTQNIGSGLIESHEGSVHTRNSCSK